MELAKEKFTKMMQENDMIDKLGICVRVAGDLSLLPRDVLQAAAKAVHYSRNNTRAILNVCLSYTSQEEMVHSVQTLSGGIEKDLLKYSDVTEDLFEKCMYIPSPPDILVRTSGEIRLSDFMLWQSSQSCLVFLRELWPDFSLWCFFKTIILYQSKCALTKERTSLVKTETKTATSTKERQAEFLQVVQAAHVEYIKSCSEQKL